MSSANKSGIGKESHDCARAAGFVSVIKVIDIGTIEVDRSFYKTQAQDTGIKVDRYAF